HSMHWDDVVVLDPSRGLGFAHKPHPRLRVGAIRGQNLQRYGAPQLLVVGQEYDPHPTATQFPQDAVGIELTQVPLMVWWIEERERMVNYSRTAARRVNVERKSVQQLFPEADQRRFVGERRFRWPIAFGSAPQIGVVRELFDELLALGTTSQMFAVLHRVSSQDSEVVKNWRLAPAYPSKPHDLEDLAGACPHFFTTSHRSNSGMSSANSWISARSRFSTRDLAK